MTIYANSSALIHFAANLPQKPYCSSDLSRLNIRPADKAIQYAYIQPNDPYNLRWLVFDIDLGELSFWRWEDRVAAPNLIVKNRDNGNCHYLYLLKTPVWMKNTGRRAAENYLTSIRAAMTLKLGADNRYSGLICKNPLNTQWHTLEITPTLYELGYLADFLDLSQTSLQKAQNNANRRLEHAAINGRNDRLFTLLRYYAYERVSKYRQIADATGDDKAAAMWDNAILHEAERINREFPNGLNFGEVKSTAKSVSRWVWNHYHPGEKYNRGVMGFGETRHDNPNYRLLLPEEKRARQSKAAEFTNQVRKDKTEEKIQDAIGQLIAENKRVSKSAVAKITGLERTKLSVNYAHLFPK